VQQRQETYGDGGLESTNRCTTSLLDGGHVGSVKGCPGDGVTGGSLGPCVSSFIWRFGGHHVKRSGARMKPSQRGDRFPETGLIDILSSHTLTQTTVQTKFRASRVKTLRFQGSVPYDDFPSWHEQLEELFPFHSSGSRARAAVARKASSGEVPVQSTETGWLFGFHSRFPEECQMVRVQVGDRPTKSRGPFLKRRSQITLVCLTVFSMDVDIESLVHLEQSYAATGGNFLSLTPRSRFYDKGYEDGFAHGQIHGLIEGRALGREKGYEMFEELGFYEGFALSWKKIYESTGRSDEFVSSPKPIPTVYLSFDLDQPSDTQYKSLAGYDSPISTD